MPREIVPGVYWIQECGHDRSHFVERDDRRTPDWYVPGHQLHIPQNAFLFRGQETLLFDTLSPASSDVIVDRLESLLDGRELDYLVVSHPDVPHAGNAFRILNEYPDATLVAPKYGSKHELYHLDDATHVGEGDSIDLGGFTVDFHEATFPDAAVHVWMSERETEMLLPVDWMGMPHMDTECLSFVDELETELDVDRLVEFHGRVLFWYQYVDVPKTKAEIGNILEKFDPEIIAPAHGNIIRENADECILMMKDVVEEINKGGRVGTFG
ncbi:MAG: MBL fold metallo-hydrolase [Halobacteria archaeon]|nr:MBL fold metallo-hydrolase [Halobacteria archaeon]